VKRSPLKRSRKPIRRRRKVKKSSLRYEVILGGAVRVYPDGREVCQDNAPGQLFYRLRTIDMADRQLWRCGFEDVGECKLPGRMMLGTQGLDSSATFEHANKRGAGKQNDSIAPETKNCAVHSICNSAVGSRRVL
jgi:hypothetical protein